MRHVGLRAVARALTFFLALAMGHGAQAAPSPGKPNARGARSRGGADAKSKKATGKGASVPRSGSRREPLGAHFENRTSRRARARAFAVRLGEVRRANGRWGLDGVTAMHLTDDPAKERVHGVFDTGNLLEARALLERGLARAKAGHFRVIGGRGAQPTSDPRGFEELILLVDMGRRIGFVGGLPGAVAGHPGTRYLRMVIVGDQVTGAAPYPRTAAKPQPTERTLRLGTGPRPIRAILFDMDGTLVDTHEMLAGQLVEAAPSIGAQVTMERARKVIDGRSPREVLEAIKPGATEEDGKTLQVAFNKASKNNLGRVRPLPGVARDLERLRDAGLRLGVATSRSPTEARKLLGSLGLARYFDVVTGTDQTGVASKPAPDLLVGAAALLGVDRARVLTVGDAPHDIEAAKRAGMPSWGVRWGMGGAQIEGAGADHVSDGTADLVHALEL